MSSNAQENISKLSFHFYNSIKVLTSFYKFVKSLKSNKSITNEKLFLIDKKWFTNYKQFYLCNDLFQLINKYNQNLCLPLCYQLFHFFQFCYPRLFQIFQKNILLHI